MLPVFIDTDFPRKRRPSLIGQLVPVKASGVETPALRFAASAQVVCSDHDVVMIYQIVLGRDPESPSVIASAISNTLAAFVRGSLYSAEFREQVLPALITRRPLPHQALGPGPAVQHRAWLARVIAFNDIARETLAAAQSWHDLFALLSRLDGFPRGAAPPILADPPPSASELPEFHFQLDNPPVAHGAAAEPLVNLLTIEGWALARTGVAAIDVRLDNIPIGDAQYGRPREDVSAAYPDWQNALRSGYIFHFPLHALLDGQHLVTLIIRARNGQQRIEQFSIDVRTAGALGNLAGSAQHTGESAARFVPLLPGLVDQIYRTLLCRPPDPEALSHYVDRLTRGIIDIRDLIDMVYDSAEYLILTGPAIEELRVAYRLLFERAPTALEIYQHVQTFRRTCSSDEDAIAVLRTKGAARARFAITSLKSFTGKPALRLADLAQNRSTDLDVLMCYQIFLGRDPESSTVIDEAKAVAIADFVHRCLASDEFRGHVLPALMARRPLRHEVHGPAPAAVHLAWLASMITCDEAAHQTVAAVQTWHDVFALLARLDAFPDCAAPPAFGDLPPVCREEPDFHCQLDSPRVAHGAATEPVTGHLVIEGWVLARAGVAAIEVRLDNTPIGMAQYGLPREDVLAAYPDWENALHSGYRFHLPADAWRAGRHRVKLIFRAHQGQELVEHFNIVISPPDAASNLASNGQPAGASAARFEHLLPPLIDQIYRSLLCRPVDAAGLRYYVPLLASGKIDLIHFAGLLYDSSEHLMVVAPAIARVQTDYRLLFEREPTALEICTHVQTFRNTCSSDDEAIAVLRTDGTARARFGIRPLKIEMDITNQCNIRCIMCPFSDPAIGGRKRRDLSLDMFSRWANEMFSAATHVGLMFGTEPTLNSNLLSFVRIAKEFRVPNVYFSTNAMKLTPALAGDLIDAGLDEVNVSLDGGTKETFERIRRKAKWDIVVGNLRSLRDQKTARKLSRPRLHMSFVMMQSNIKELPQFVELAAELGAVVLYFTHLVAYDGLGTITESLGTNVAEYQPYIDQALLLARQHRIHAVLPRTRQARLDITPPTRPTPDPHANHLTQIDLAREAHSLPQRFAADEANSCCPFPWHFMAIDPDGSVFPCGWWHSGPAMGNLYTQSFQDIWLGEPRRNLRSQLISRQLGANCSKCPAAGMGRSDSSDSFQSR